MTARYRVLGKVITVTAIGDRVFVAPADLQDPPTAAEITTPANAMAAGYARGWFLVSHELGSAKE